MKTVQWLQRYAPGFSALSDRERQVITEFSFLWSLFEAKVLDAQGSARTIVAIANLWGHAGQLTGDTFGPELAYFRSRYVEGDQFTYHFDHLHVRGNDKPDLVRRVLVTDDAEPEEVAAVVLIIVYRFRNNLFHGVKWSYELQGQLENFTKANSALMCAIELQENMPARGV